MEKAKNPDQDLSFPVVWREYIIALKQIKPRSPEILCREAGIKADYLERSGLKGFS